jgi:argininosuccinate lyase
MSRPKSRFRLPLDQEALRFSTSLPVDRRLYSEDIAGSLAHAAMLAKRRIISAAEARAIARGLRAIKREIASGKFPLAPRKGGRSAAEDIHMAIEARLIEKIGPAGARLHTARSRNDQVALDERLYLVRTIREIVRLVRGLQKSLVRLARRNREVVMPGYTHLQRGQPILLAHHLLAYVGMLDRDAGRFGDALRRTSASPLGAGALAGTSFPLDREMVARRVGLGGTVENSIDAVSDRDALLEFLAASAITMMHLSRLAEELVLWSSQEWRFAEIGEAYTTGSSMMPQKKNPDMAELIRGKTGRVYGGLVALLTVMKGLPLAYNRDMQEDKEPLFDAAETLASSLSVMARMLATVRFDAKRFESELDSGALLATELADYLARKGMPFREAHGVAGAIVAQCARRGTALPRLPLADYRRFSRLFEADIYLLLSARGSIERKRSAGSTAPSEVRRALARWERRLRA